MARRHVLSRVVGGLLVATAAAWFVTWGSIVASAEPPMPRPFWIVPSFIATAALVLGVVLLAVGEADWQAESPSLAHRGLTYFKRRRVRKELTRPIETSKPSPSPVPSSRPPVLDGLPHALEKMIDEGVRIKENLWEGTVGRVWGNLSPEPVMPTTEQDVRAWERDVSVLLSGHPIQRAEFRLEPPRRSFRGYAQAFATPLADRMTFRLSQLEKIIKELS